MDRNFCAFLRGVNVNGTNMKMAEAVSVFENAGMKNVVSVLASGNIVFSSDKNEDELRILLQECMSFHFKYDAYLFVKSKDEIQKMLGNNVFPLQNDFHTYVFICENNFEKVLFDEFIKSDKIEDEEAKINGLIFYWKIRKGNSLGSGFSKILGKKQFKDKFTSRNLNTIEKVLKKM